MDFKSLTSDEIERILARIEQKISQARGLQLDALEELDRRQVFTADGCRSLTEWTSGRLDVGKDTAQKLVRTMRRTAQRTELREQLASGMSFDRVEARAALPDSVGRLDHLDISGIRRTVGRHAEVTTDQEQKNSRDRYLVLQPSLDESWWKVRGGLDGVAGSVVDRALTDLADRLPDLPDGTRPGNGWRKATALYELASGGATPEATITVFVDAERAVQVEGRAGVALEAGPRVGQQALAAILCGSTSEVTVRAEDGTPMRYGRTSRAIPPALRRAVLAVTDGVCAIDGCDSAYRVEVHHRTPWSDGGTTDPENLVALCWFHHHIVVHERGFELYEDSAHGRLRLRRPRFEPTPDCRAAEPRVRLLKRRRKVLVGARHGTQPKG